MPPKGKKPETPADNSNYNRHTMRTLPLSRARISIFEEGAAASVPQRSEPHPFGSPFPSPLREGLQHHLISPGLMPGGDKQTISSRRNFYPAEISASKYRHDETQSEVVGDHEILFHRRPNQSFTDLSMPFLRGESVGPKEAKRSPIARLLGDVKVEVYKDQSPLFTLRIGKMPKDRKSIKEMAEDSVKKMQNAERGKIAIYFPGGTEKEIKESFLEFFLTTFNEEYRRLENYAKVKRSVTRGFGYRLKKRFQDIFSSKNIHTKITHIYVADQEDVGLVEKALNQEAVVEEEVLAEESGYDNLGDEGEASDSDGDNSISRATLPRRELTQAQRDDQFASVRMSVAQASRQHYKSGDEIVDSDDDSLGHGATLPRRRASKLVHFAPASQFGEQSSMLPKFYDKAPKAVMERWLKLARERLADVQQVPKTQFLLAEGGGRVMAKVESYSGFNYPGIEILLKERGRELRKELIKKQKASVTINEFQAITSLNIGGNNVTTLSAKDALKAFMTGFNEAELEHRERFDLGYLPLKEVAFRRQVDLEVALGVVEESANLKLQEYRADREAEDARMMSLEGAGTYKANPPSAKYVEYQKQKYIWAVRKLERASPPPPVIDEPTTPQSGLSSPSLDLSDGSRGPLQLPQAAHSPSRNGIAETPFAQPAPPAASRGAYASRTEGFKDEPRRQRDLPKKTSVKAEAVSTNTIWRRDEGGDYVFMLEDRPDFGKERTNTEKDRVIKAKDVEKIFSIRGDGVLVVDTEALRIKIKEGIGKPNPNLAKFISVSALVGKVPGVVAK